MWLFKAQVDTINARELRVFFNPSLYKYNLTVNFKVENTAYEYVATELRETALDGSFTAYMACLFFNTSDNGR